MAGNADNVKNNAFDRMLFIMCLSGTLSVCDNYFCPSQKPRMMQLSFLLQFLINVTAIKCMLIKESLKWHFTPIQVF